MSMPMGGSMPGILCGWIMGMGTQMMAYGRDLNLIKALGLSLDTRERERGREGGSLIGRRFHIASISYQINNKLLLGVLHFC